MDAEERRQYSRDYYARRLAIDPEYGKRLNQKKLARRKQVQKDLQELKAACMDCGEFHPACLQFHHRDPSQKSFEVAKARRSGKTLKALLPEIAKCDVLCANCHAKRHWQG
jgi:hypothetical protein